MWCVCLIQSSSCWATFTQAAGTAEPGKQTENPVGVSWRGEWTMKETILTQTCVKSCSRLLPCSLSPFLGNIYECELSFLKHLSAWGLQMLFYATVSNLSCLGNAFNPSGDIQLSCLFLKGRQRKRWKYFLTTVSAASLCLSGNVTQNSWRCGPLQGTWSTSEWGGEESKPWRRRSQKHPWKTLKIPSAFSKLEIVRQSIWKDLVPKIM